MKKKVRSIIDQALKKARDSGELQLADMPDIVVEQPKDEKLGDFATTIAMNLARSERKPPREIAAILCGHLQNGAGLVESVQTAGPGFINIKMSPSFFQDQFLQAVKLGDDFGKSEIGKDQKVHLEFVSANPTGPLHVGHGRGAAVGHTLSQILKRAGYDVHTEYYVNDVGNQMNTLGRSTWFRYQELLGRSVEFPEDHYKGKYIQDIAQEIIDKESEKYLDKPEEEILPFFKKFAADWVLSGIKQDLADFRVEFDCWFSEKSLYEDDSVDKALDRLREKEFVYEKDGALWLKSSAFKDDKDRVIIKENGEKTYFCSDIAYHKNKIDQGVNQIIDIWGADHHGYVARMQAVMESMEFDLEAFKILLVQFVSLKRGNEKVSMSTRSGEFVTLEEVIAEVGVDAARFFFMMRSCDSHLDFDLELAKKETPENPVYYIQYAHARICSIFRTAEERGIALSPIDEADVSILREEEELALVKKILMFTEVIEKSAQTLEPHRICFYLQDLVAAFHSYYNKHRVVTSDKTLTEARLLLVDCLRGVIKNGLKLMGVSAPEKM